ncbi:large subunit ribosomal protein L21 [Tistlia consotensis]|uniref:Large ribosomal subunit protein bL21 n=1 Tax=Tistlia consotensis USBA 355 TaxID=560819 RepID=A0A1Y6BGJ8_9PROT|nr:50S ribosomal protein L21 [Tistlia consotensis]SMF08050.1 large subunit ribosomal protein L21 [Tistlia consotensis USBA 355]SNR35564.1 large subunit ribosomal protein L21 [Tistlia consotensis]
MYAVIKTGGKQYRVKQDDVLTVERLPGEAGNTVTFDQVLMVSGESGLSVGSPTLSGASVTAELVGPVRGERLTIFKKTRRKHHRRKMGHRQDLTKVRITGITAG